MSLIFSFASCADEKEFIINNEKVVVEPYGWANRDTQYNDSILYEVNGGNIVWSVILSETIFVPIWLTGWQLYEPLKKK